LILIKVHADSAEYWSGPSSKLIRLIGGIRAAVTRDPDKFPAENEESLSGTALAEGRRDEMSSCSRSYRLRVSRRVRLCWTLGDWASNGWRRCRFFAGLTVGGYGWRHHPAVKMWAGYEDALARYGLEVCRAWTEEGRADTCRLTLLRDLADGCAVRHLRTQDELGGAGDLPPWLGDEALHASHRSALLRKDPEYYGALFNDPPGLPYVWPSSDRKPCREPAGIGRARR